jgi:tRNA A37 methylthiotransferase MiaB
MEKIKVGLISLGCEKNLVDSEMILGVCKEAGFDNVSFEWHWADKQEKTDSTFVSSESD